MKSIPQVKNIFILFLIFTFCLGVFLCLSNPSDLFPVEKMTTLDDEKTPEISGNADISTCPNVLIRQGGSLLLYNTLEKESDQNPIPFYNLDEYLLYVKSQRNKGVRCPVLYLQQENDTQGNDIFRVRNSPFSVEGGLPTKVIPITIENAALDNPPYNQGQYHGFDPHSQYIGKYTNLDQIHDSTRQTPISDNPMDTNWGGVIHSQQAVESGKYDENTVGKPVMIPRVLALQP